MSTFSLPDIFGRFLRTATKKGLKIAALLTNRQILRMFSIQFSCQYQFIFCSFFRSVAIFSVLGTILASKFPVFNVFKALFDDKF